MRAFVQRVNRCSVSIDGSQHSSIGAGLLALLGVRRGDTETDADYLAERVGSLRVFSDADGKMNLNTKDVKGSVMVVSQFTLYADTRRGNRPSYSDAAAADAAERLYDRFVRSLILYLGEDRVATGVFGADMKVELVNDGPVTIQIESKANSLSE